MATKQKKPFTNPQNEMKTCLMPIGFLVMRQRHGSLPVHACSGCKFLKRSKKQETMATCTEYDHVFIFKGHWTACGLWEKK